MHKTHFSVKKIAKFHKYIQMTNYNLKRLGNYNSCSQTHLLGFTGSDCSSLLINYIISYQENKLIKLCSKFFVWSWLIRYWFKSLPTQLCIVQWFQELLCFVSRLPTIGVIHLFHQSAERTIILVETHACMFSSHHLHKH